MLADPRHSCVVLLNVGRHKLANDQVASLRYRRSLDLVAACQELFGVRRMAVGEYDHGGVPDGIAASIEHLDIDGLSMWMKPQFVTRLTDAEVGLILLGGAYLEEEVLVAALEGARRGYDIRLLSDLSLARDEADRSLTVARLGHHGIIATTVRQTLLEWAVSLGDQAVVRKVQSLLS